MIINDLQYIESANEEVKGGGRRGRGRRIRPFNQAGGNATSDAFGFNTKAFTDSDSLVIEGQLSSAFSNSYSESF